MDRFSRRQVKVTKEQNEECRRLLRLMGIPVVVVRSVLYLHSNTGKFDMTNRLHQKLKLNALNLLEVARYAHIPSDSNSIVNSC